MKMGNIYIFLNGERGVRVASAVARAGHGIGALIVPVGKLDVVENCSREMSLAVREVDDVNGATFRDWFVEQNPELSIIAGFSTIFRPPVIAIPTRGTINLHTGRLPQYRGGSPLNWQMINGEIEAGISVIEVDEGIDTGAILSEARLPIGATDTIATMHEHANKKFPELVLNVLTSLENNSLVPRKQDEAKACYWHQRQDADGYLRLDRLNVEEVDRFIRALTRPYPGAFGFVDGKKVRLLKASRTNMRMQGTLGRICFIQKQGPYLVCRDGALLLEEYLFEGDVDRRLRHGDYIQ